MQSKSFSPRNEYESYALVRYVGIRYFGASEQLMGNEQSSPRIAPQDDQYSSSTTRVGLFARHAALTFIFTFGKVDGGRKSIQ